MAIIKLDATQMAFFSRNSALVKQRQLTDALHASVGLYITVIVLNKI